MTDRPTITVKAVRAGPLAKTVLTTVARANIAAVFERSLYLEAGDRFVCLGGNGIGDGPINIIVAGVDTGWIASSAVGDPVQVSCATAQSPTWTLVFDGISTWRPAPWPPPPSPKGLRGTLERALAIAHGMQGNEGLLPLVIEKGRPPQNAFQRTAAPRLERLEQWLCDCLTGDSHPTCGAPVGLLGLGPGLTPSGDDMLCGCMIALLALGAGRTGQTFTALSSAITRESAHMTSPLSRQFLLAATAGLGSAALHDFIRAALTSDCDVLHASLASLAAIGHTSGLDACAGVLMTLSAFEAASREQRSLS